MSAKCESRYSGALNAPIVRPLGLLYGPTSPKGAKAILRARLIKLLLLLEHYEIKPDDPARWPKLAFLLALDHVCGMQVVESPPAGPGRPRKRPDVSEAQQLVRIIDEITHERGRGVMDAIQIALRRKKLKGSYESLEARYYENVKLLRRVEELERRLPTGFDPESK